MSQPVGLGIEALKTDLPIAIDHCDRVGDEPRMLFDPLVNALILREIRLGGVAFCNDDSALGLLQEWKLLYTIGRSGDHSGEEGPPEADEPLDSRSIEERGGKFE